MMSILSGFMQQSSAAHNRKISLNVVYMTALSTVASPRSTKGSKWCLQRQRSATDHMILIGNTLECLCMFGIYGYSINVAELACAAVRWVRSLTLHCDVVSNCVDRRKKDAENVRNHFD